ncbi:hypothetical protein EAH89_18860 [Roseomonas nepalensis]|uniref:Guanylate cyclase domain-containing protein n=1 Tax=Muricoccus nepalensis TaxID=1854500 RepID=A0A502FSB0_9PROT|nr:adenylate/guanylate cyclase domain-containing protein [Roseomonas nepalensis]TPG52334.1 hypothetical protein EAH89_18860 [Roseomonas nepalensis]
MLSETSPIERDITALKRRHATIVFADIVGYSVLAAANEDYTTARWLRLFKKIVAPAASAEGGRIVDVQGDGTLAEFPDVQSGLRWAKILHQASRVLDQQTSDDVPIVFRIAIHHGNVIVEGDRILGDAVNMAARLQEYCTPGGTLLSAEAALLLSPDDRAVMRDLGKLPLRNLTRAVHALSLDPPENTPVPIPLAPTQLPSVAVLPLFNLSADPADEYLASGLVEDVVASLSRLGELFVISPDSARMFRGQNPSPQRAARTLGVRFVVSGNLRRAGGGLHASFRLTDGVSGEHLWGERMDVAEHEIFAVQEHVTARIVAGVSPSIRATALRDAMRKRPDSLTSYDHMLRGLHLMASSERDAFIEARGHLIRAMEEDPSFAQPIAWAAQWHSLRIGQGWSENREEDAEAVFSFAERALDLDSANSLGLAVLGHNSAYLRRDLNTAQYCFGRALAVCPNSAIAWTLSSATLSYLGRGKEAAAHAERGLRLSPYDPLSYYQQHFLSIAHYTARDLEQAERCGCLAIGGNPAHASSWRMQAVILAAQGRVEEAKEAGYRLIALEPEFGIASYTSRRMPFQDSGVRMRFAEDLRKAGLPR